jgi:ABC-type sugar transport system substrate-binding protein
MATSAPLRCHLAALVLAVLLAAAAGAAAGGEVVQLDDKTFEHHTQAGWKKKTFNPTPLNP